MRLQEVMQEGYWFLGAALMSWDSFAAPSHVIAQVSYLRIQTFDQSGGYFPSKPKRSHSIFN